MSTSSPSSIVTAARNSGIAGTTAPTFPWKRRSTPAAGPSNAAHALCRPRAARDRQDCRRQHDARKPVWMRRDDCVGVLVYLTFELHLSHARRYFKLEVLLKLYRLHVRSGVRRIVGGVENLRSQPAQCVEQ